MDGIPPPQLWTHTSVCGSLRAEQATDAVRSQTLRIDPAVRRIREHVQVSGYFGDADRGFIRCHYRTGVVG